MKDDANISDEKGRISRTSSLRASFSRLGESLLQPSGQNKKISNLHIPNMRLVQKAEFKKQASCQVCFYQFDQINRQHHCRVCANAICSSCGSSYINKEKACDLCVYHYVNLEKEKFKADALETLKKVALQYLSRKNQTEEEIKNIEEAIPNEAGLQKEQFEFEQRIKRLNARLADLARTKQSMEAELEQIRNS